MNAIRPSALVRLEACPTSAALPQAGNVSTYATHGNEVHAYLAAYLRGDDPATPKGMDVIDLSRIPVCPGTVETEVKLYRGALEGTADVVGLTDDAVVVLDFKTGWTPQPPARAHAQLLWYGIAAAETFKRRRAILGIVRIKDDGGVWSDIADLSGWDLDDAADRIDGIIHRAMKAKATDKVTTGDHCKYCPAFRHCPETVGLVSMMAEDPRMLGEEVRLDLTPENAARAWDRVKLAEKIVDEVKASLKVYAETVGPFTLSNGNVVGPVETSRRSPDPLVTLDVLTKLHGESVAKSAVKFEPSTSLTAIKESIAAIAPKGKAAGMVREVEAAIEAAGGMKSTGYASVKEYKPKKEIDSGNR